MYEKTFDQKLSKGYKIYGTVSDTVLIDEAVPFSAPAKSSKKAKKAVALNKWDAAVDWPPKGQTKKKVKAKKKPKPPPKPKKPKFSVPATTPDIDKLLRAVLDGMVWKDKEGDGKWHGILIEDDARFISVGTSERFVSGDEPTGVHIWVWAA